MSSAVDKIAMELRGLSAEELGRVRAIVEGLFAGASAQPEVYGEPLTDDDIEEAARVSFSALDESETQQG